MMDGDMYLFNYADNYRVLWLWFVIFVFLLVVDIVCVGDADKKKFRRR